MGTASLPTYKHSLQMPQFSVLILGHTYLLLLRKAGAPYFEMKNKCTLLDWRSCHMSARHVIGSVLLNGR